MAVNVVNVSGVDYEEQVLDGNTILVPVKEKKEKVALKLTQRQAEALFDILSVVMHDDYCETTRPRWEDRAYSEFFEFSDKAEEFAAKIHQELRDKVVDNDYDIVSDKWETHFVTISEKRKRLPSGY